METARIFLTGGALIISIVYMAIPVIIAGSLVSISKTLRHVSGSLSCILRRLEAQRPYVLGVEKCEDVHFVETRNPNA